MHTIHNFILHTYNHSSADLSLSLEDFASKKNSPLSIIKKNIGFAFTYTQCFHVLKCKAYPMENLFGTVNHCREKNSAQ